MITQWGCEVPGGGRGGWAGRKGIRVGEFCGDCGLETKARRHSEQVMGNDR